MQFQKGLVWLRRDLRLRDNQALGAALSCCESVYLVFIFDPEIIADLPKDDPRITFIWQSLADINEQLHKTSSASITVLHGKPLDMFPRLLSQGRVNAVFANHDYEPSAIARDNSVARICQEAGVRFFSFKDQVIFEKKEIIKDNSEPYRVFTPYKNKWLTTLDDAPPASPEVGEKDWKRLSNLELVDKTITALDQTGFVLQSASVAGGETEANKRWSNFVDRALESYEENRNLPAIQGTSSLSPYLRFGNLSIRDMVKTLHSRKDGGSVTFLSELIWREFFMMILYNYPHVATSCFYSEYDRLQWDTDEGKFRRWCEGKTGFPIVDAGMRELNTTGLMHNRVRMIAASFLVKHLHMDWRWGEQYFADRLFDFELSSNNGNWQWVAGTGVDAAPYFRIFNPLSQAKKFDPDAIYIKKWVPELVSMPARDIHRLLDLHKKAGYVQPMIDLDEERKKCLALYGEIKNVR